MKAIEAIEAIEEAEETYQVWQLSANRQNRLIARPVSMLDAFRLVDTAAPQKYTYALIWHNEKCVYFIGKIGGRLSETDHRLAAYKLLRRDRN